MNTLHIDIETFSPENLAEVGVHKYVDNPDFRILLIGYAYDDAPVDVLDLSLSEDIDVQMEIEELLQALQDPSIRKTAYNAAFERTCLSKYFSINLPPEQWQCTMIWAWELGLPASLGRVAEHLGLKEQKDRRGKALIRYFCTPAEPSLLNGGRTRNLPASDPDGWRDFVEYCRQDVVTDREVRRKLSKYPVADSEWALWALDQRINDRGVRVSLELARSAVKVDREVSGSLMRDFEALTGVAGPKCNAAFRKWLNDEGLSTPNGIGSKEFEGLYENAPNLTVKKALDLARDLMLSSTTKYQTMIDCACSDERVKGVLQFYGATRTGRWAGRRVQMHNLPRNYIDDLATARSALLTGDAELLELMYPSVPKLLSQLIRTALIPKEGHRFIVSDFSAIEARVLAWVADEKWVLDVFRGDGRIYETTAAMMFHVPVSTIVKGHENYALRSKGKVAVLACGYQGGVNALVAMGALRSGIAEDELPIIIAQYREANKKIRQFWYDIENAAIDAVSYKKTVQLRHGVRMRYAPGFLFVDLPSGRSLAYPKPAIERDEKFDKFGLTFYTEKGTAWTKERTYGGKLTENLVQAIARDCLAESMKRLEKAGYEIVMHVHDEVILEVPNGQGSVEEVNRIMGETIPWAPGLPLAAAGFECEFYQKD